MDGDTETETDPVDTAAGRTVMTAFAVFVESAALTAVTETVCGDATLAGGVYNPAAEIAPSCGEIDHETAVFDDPLTVAVNCCALPPAARFTEAGATETDTELPGTRLMTQV